MELADSIEEVKATCHFCNRKSIMNLKHVNGAAVDEGLAIELGAEEKYFPTCYKCYVRELDKAKIAKMAIHLVKTDWGEGERIKNQGKARKK